MRLLFHIVEFRERDSVQVGEVAVRCRAAARRQPVVREPIKQVPLVELATACGNAKASASLSQLAARPTM